MSCNNNQNQPKCPTCGSTNIEKISVAKKRLVHSGLVYSAKPQKVNFIARITELNSKVKDV